MTLQQAFGSVLRELRNEVRLSQEQLALASGLDRTFISQLERGLKQPSLSTLIALSSELKVDPPKLVRLTLDRINEDSSNQDIN